MRRELSDRAPRRGQIETARRDDDCVGIGGGDRLPVEALRVCTGVR
ncbi:MAG: hypothetical protein WA814_06925 [Candidatus Baltobacteraceae bacterium]